MLVETLNQELQKKMSSHQTNIKIIISGGGTGGHIFPAIAIANALKIIQSHVDILFIGALGKMEMEKIPAAGYSIEGLWISGLQRKLSYSNLLFPFKLISSIKKAKQIIKRFKPDVAVGVGGYASGPMLYAATKKGIPTLIQEQNSYPGITNKLLANKVNKICVAYKGMEKYFPKEKILLTGNPVRQDILNLEGKKQPALEHFQLNENKKILLVIGGSLGARTINESLLAGLDELTKNNIQLIWQTGKLFYEKAKAATKLFEKEGIRVVEFITKMDYAYSIADVIISRAGAGSISELSLIKKPCVLVPSPNVAEDHQTRNAMVLINNNAALLVKDQEAREQLISTTISLINNNVLKKNLATNISGFAIPNSAEHIAKEILNLVKKK